MYENELLSSGHDDAGVIINWRLYAAVYVTRRSAMVNDSNSNYILPCKARLVLTIYMKIIYIILSTILFSIHAAV